MKTSLHRILSGILSAWMAIAALASHAQEQPKDVTARAEAAFRSGDLIVAMRLFRNAAEAGYAPAQARLGDILDAAEENAEAVAWYRKAAEQDEPAGFYGLGHMTAIGEGIARDTVQALALIRRAAEKDYIPAIEALARFSRSGSMGLPRDLAEAEQLERRAKSLREASKGSR